MTLTLSPSKLEAFDDTTPFGCSRRWWFEHASVGPKKKVAQTPQMMIGDGLHKEIEDFLKTGKQYENPSRLFLSGLHLVRDVMSEGLGPIEQWIAFEVAGVPFRGRMDLRLGNRPLSGKSRGVLDWKTTSSIAKYAKTESQLRTNHQMVLYAGHLLRHDLADSPVAIEHVYFQTKGAELAKRVQSTVTGKQIAAHIENTVVPLVEQIKLADIETDVSKVKRTLSKDKCQRCPHLTICPRDGVPLMSFMDRFRAVQQQKEAVANGVPTQAAPPPAPVLPPDAPKSDPAKAADPVPGFSPTIPPTAPQVRRIQYPAAPDAVVTAETPIPQAPAEAAPKRPGRPPGAKNKPKEAAPPPAPPPPAPAMAPVAPPPVPKAIEPARSFEIVEVSFTQGLTVNLGDYQSARFDISAKATCAPGAAQGALVELKRFVFEQLDESVSAVLKK